MTQGIARPAFERMKIIWAFVRAGYHPNCTDLARLLETSTKSIQRDLDFLRDRLQLPITYNSAWHGFEVAGKPRCCFCCDPVKLIAHLDLQRKPQPLFFEPVKGTKNIRTVLRQECHGHLKLKRARKTAKKRYDARYYREVVKPERRSKVS